MPFAELSDVRCHYQIVGSGDPVLMIPGLGTTCTLWDCVTPQLSRSFSLIAIDNRDIGLSMSKRPPASLADFCSDLIELMDYLQLDRAHVMGLSLGGIIAQRLAIEHPSRIDKLVLVSCSHRFGPYLRQIATLLGQALRYFPPDVFRRTIELLGSSPQYLDAHAEEVEKKIATEAQSCIPRPAIIRQLRCLDCEDVAMGGEYRIDAPTLVIAGEQDMLIPACYARAMAREIPGSEFLLVPEAGHNPLLERPDFVVPRLIEFLGSQVGTSYVNADHRTVMKEAVLTAR